MTVPGTTEVLAFAAVPEVVAGLALFILQAQNDPAVAGIPAAPGGRTAGNAPVTLPGSTLDPEPDFTLRFASQEFTANGYRFEAKIEDVVFSGAPDPTSAFPNNPSNPIDAEAFVLTLTLLDAPDGDGKHGRGHDHHDGRDHGHRGHDHDDGHGHEHDHRDGHGRHGDAEWWG